MAGNKGVLRERGVEGEGVDGLAQLFDFMRIRHFIDTPKESKILLTSLWDLNQ